MELQQLPRIMTHTECSPVMQSIHILRDQARHPAAGEEAGEAVVSGVGGSAGEGGPAQEGAGPVARPVLRRGHELQREGAR